MKKLLFPLFLVAMLIFGCSFSSKETSQKNTILRASEILSMEDGDMYDALMERFMDTEPSTLNGKQRTVAVLITFDADNLNGGLCQFFVNDHAGYAQYVCDALGEIGATEMQVHYLSFIKQNRIDVTKMDSFRIEGVQDYSKQLERFPFEAFDNTFSEIYQRENLADLLLSYVRLHSDEILD